MNSTVKSIRTERVFDHWYQVLMLHSEGKAHWLLQNNNLILDKGTDYEHIKCLCSRQEAQQSSNQNKNNFVFPYPQNYIARSTDMPIMTDTDRRPTHLIIIIIIIISLESGQSRRCPGHTCPLPKHTMTRLGCYWVLKKHFGGQL